jgi:hypothetical protein
VPVTLGCLPAGAARFAGHIDRVRVARVARSDDWIRTAYRNLRSPATFARLAAEAPGD